MTDKEFLLNVREWPAFEFGRYCCLKKRSDNMHEYAFIVILDEDLNGTHGNISIALGNIFSGGTGQTVVYKSVDHLLEDGWLVD